MKLETYGKKGLGLSLISDKLSKKRKGYVPYGFRIMRSLHKEYRHIMN